MLERTLCLCKMTCSIQSLGTIKFCSNYSNFYIINQERLIFLLKKIMIIVKIIIKKINKNIDFFIRLLNVYIEYILASKKLLT